MEPSKSLKPSKEWFKHLIEHTSDKIALLDVDGEFLYVSPADERILGFRPEERIGLNAFEFIHPDDTEKAREKFQQVTEKDAEWVKAEYRHRHNGGSWVWMESTIWNRTSSPLEGYVVASRDITDRKDYEQRLEELREELEALNRILRHDIRNDIGVILGWANELEGHVDAAGEDYRQKICDSGYDVVELTVEAREYVELLNEEDGHVEQEVRFDRLLSPVLTTHRKAHPTADFQVHGAIPEVKVAGTQMLASVFRNLLTNAIQHNDRDSPLVKISAQEEEEAILVTVADNGPGIPDANKECVFEQGQKGLNSSSTGIGLYLVAKMAEQVGGDAWVKDNEPRGAKFVVRLPKSTPDTESATNMGLQFPKEDS